MVEILFDSFATRFALSIISLEGKEEGNWVFITMYCYRPWDLKALKSRSLLLTEVKCKGTLTNENQTPLPALVLYDLLVW